jgi:uncharacterized membrane protein
MRRLLTVLVLAAALLVTLPTTAVSSPVRAADFDCKESPTPDMPGRGLAAFFQKEPDPIPAQGDPFAPGAKTTIYEQYGYAGLRWETYDLGCGPDSARHPDAVIGTALSNWMMNVPIALTALTASITETAFEPTFLNVFDPAITKVSQALHDSLFATWVPVVIALLGILILFRARRAALATTAAAIGWALMVVLVATAIFRWPIEAGHFADDTVTSTLGTVVGDVNGAGQATKPGVAVASSVHESMFYTTWLAGTLGSTDSETAKKYGPDLFKVQALTWHEAQIVENDPDRGQELIDAKKDRYGEIAGQIKNEDPAAYEHLTGKRPDTRIGYAMLSGLGAMLALPFLLISALLLLGSFLIVRLAVMLFPAFATLGVFPAGRGAVLGIGRTVGAALINAVIFGIGAAVTIRVLGVILDPASKLPGWLAFVLMPLFGFMMWMALKPFRRLTAMVSQNADPFNDAAGSVGDAARSTGRYAKKAAAGAAAVYTGNVAAAATIAAVDDDQEQESAVPDRAEARPTPVTPGELPAATPPRRELPAADRPAEQTTTGGTPPPPPGPSPSQVPASNAEEYPVVESTVPATPSEGAPLPPTEPEWQDGEEVFAIYRPSDDGLDDDAA